MSGIQFESTFSGSIRLRVTYFCAHCQKLNVDGNQTIKLVVKSEAAFDSAKMARENAERNYMERVEKTLEDVKNKNFRSLKLNCTCAACGQRPVWSQYKEPLLSKLLLWFGALILAGMVLLFAILHVNDISLPFWAYLIPVAMMAPYAVFAICNAVIDSKVKKADERFLPQIDVIPPNGSKGA